LFNIDPYLLPLGLFTWLHDWFGLMIVALTLLHLGLNWAWIKGMTQKLISSQVKIYSATVLIILFVVSAFFLIKPASKTEPTTESINADDQNNPLEIIETPEIETRPEQTLPNGEGRINIKDIGEFTFPVKAVETSRPDIFKPGAFSVFDILVYLDMQEQIDLAYHFSDDHDTHIIDTINGLENWWYIAYYDGGWAENNVWPMDLFPYKERMSITIRQESPEEISEIYSVISDQVARGGGTNIAIPEVEINGPTGTQKFNNVLVTAHDLRDDYLQDGTITAIDVIMSLGDQGLINYSLNWYESIGSAGVVKNYFVDGINDDQAAGRCGFVYELGDRNFYGFRGNHIHIPPDLRVIISIPQYVEFFWICI